MLCACRLLTTNCKPLLSVISQRWLERALILRTWFTFTMALRCTRWNSGSGQPLRYGAQTLCGQQALPRGDDPHQLALGLEGQHVIGIEQDEVGSAPPHNLAALSAAPRRKG